MLLALETSCDETSAAVVHDSRVLSNVVASQTRLHAEYGGVVPELAAREHLRNLLPIVRAALTHAGAHAGQIEAVAATRGPGLPSALRAGYQAGQAAAFFLRRPFLGIHHHEAHLYSPWIQGSPPAADFSEFEPHVSLIVSGGHTLLVHVSAPGRHRVLGSTMDDAAGECFDKIGKLLGLSYPAGPEIDRLAEGGNPKAHNFPRPMLNEPHDDFSFSGLKTSVRYFLRDHPELSSLRNSHLSSHEGAPDRGLPPPEQALRDMCASVQAAIVEVLVRKTQRAAGRLGVRCVTASGGVVCNRSLRKELESAAQKNGLRLRLAAREFCADNAAMIGILAERKLSWGSELTKAEAEVLPGWELE